MGYNLTWNDKSLTIKLHGIVDTETQKGVLEIYKDPKVDKLDSILWDGRSVDKLSVSKNDVVLCSAYAIGQSFTKPNVKVAILVPPKIDFKPLTTFTEKVNSLSSWEAKLFHKVRDANDWMDRRLPVNT